MNLREFEGTFVGESGARGENVHASDDFLPEVQEEEGRVVANDPLRKRNLSRQWQRSPFTHIEHDVTNDWVTRRYKMRSDSACWPMNEAYVEPGEIPARDENFAPPLVGKMLRRTTKKLLRRSPAHIVELYQTSGPKGRFDVLNLLPRLVAELVNEGVYSLGLFRQIRLGGFSIYSILHGHAAEERRVTGREDGIACQIIEILQWPV